MTDSEKELRRLAEYVRQNPGVAVKLAIACGAREVIALLDRIEALEKQVGEAERKGAEEMRRRAGALLRVSAEMEVEAGDGECSLKLRSDAAAIEHLNLPGDAP